MNFIDHTGHIFLLDSYNIEPIGYEYDECKYVFWFTGESGYKISVDNYAVLPIRCLLDKSLYGDSNIEIEISIKSNVFALLGSKVIQEKLEGCKSLSEGITLLDNLYGGEEKDIKHFKLTNDDLVIFEKETQDNEDNYIFVPFYVIVNGEEPGTWETNILIHAKSEDYEEWCPITVGAELVDECDLINTMYENCLVEISGELNFENIFENFLGSVNSRSKGSDTKRVEVSDERKSRSEEMTENEFERLKKRIAKNCPKKELCHRCSIGDCRLLHGWKKEGDVFRHSYPLLGEYLPDLKKVVLYKDNLTMLVENQHTMVCFPHTFMSCSMLISIMSRSKNKLSATTSGK